MWDPLLSWVGQLFIIQECFAHVRIPSSWFLPTISHGTPATSLWRTKDPPGAFPNTCPRLRITGTQKQDLAHFFYVNGQIVNSLNFVNHMFFYNYATQWTERPCSNKTLWKQVVGWICSVDCNVPVSPSLDQAWWFSLPDKFTKAAGCGGNCGQWIEGLCCEAWKVQTLLPSLHFWSFLWGKIWDL
jgi:hypothetical protein